jgi:exodeoxyribonuclease V gamma subunit
VLHIHRAERADGLLGALGTLLADPLPDPFAAEVIAVPTRGIERWLSQQLSNRLGATPGRRDGVCANVDFPFPRRLAGDAVAAACGVDPETDPWLPERAVWPLLEVVDACLAEPWMRSLAAHLGGAGTAPDPQRRARRLGAVRHLADLFDRYAPTTRRPRRSGRAPPGRPSCSAACDAGSASPGRPSASTRRAPGCARTPASSPSRRAWPSSA